MTTQPNSSVRRILGVAVALMVVVPGVALAQPPRQPVVELGVQVSKKTSDSGLVGQALRVTVPLNRRTAIEATTDIQTQTSSSAWETSEREFSVHWRQTVFASGRLQIFGVLGGGRNRVQENVPELIYLLPGRDGPIVEPAHTFVRSEFVAHFGPAVQVELARWLALRGDLQGIIGSGDSGVRGMVGVVIPIRRFGADDQPAQSTPPPAAWRRVKPGREVWVTTNTGSLVHGDIAAISDSSLSIREQDREVTIRLDDVRLVEGRDSLKNGFLIGGASGALAGGVVLTWIASVACESDPCGSAGAFVVGAVSGAVAGGLLGLMVDGLIPGRQTLFRGSTTVVTPVITPTKKTIDVAIHWR